MAREGFRPPRTGNVEADRGFQEITRNLNMILEGAASQGIQLISFGRGGGGGGSGASLKPRSGAYVEVYLYKATDPDNPDTLIGDTTTDSYGYWEYDLATYCWDNSIRNPFMVSYLLDGVLQGHRTVPDHFWDNQAGDGLLPLLVSMREVLI